VLGGYTVDVLRSWLVLALVIASARLAAAGPPFVTDDPEPVEHEHWEIYLASQDQHDADGWTGTAPHLEINYGAIENLQLHLIAPLAYANPVQGSSAYGIGDLELGAKYRFVQETSWCPQIGTFPLVELPAGDPSRGLGDGHIQVFVPIWLQKSIGPWTSYGGGGYWFHPGTGNRDWVLVGLELQRKLTDQLALGAEIFHGTSPADGVAGDTRFNLGAMFDATDHHHILISAGSGGSGGFQGYLAYQLTFGP
jgi:hypothetical protein